MKSGQNTSGIPNFVLAVASAVILGATAIAVLGAVTVGATWDERSLVRKLQNFFDSGWHTVAPLIDGVPDPDFFLGTYVYGPVGSLLPHLVNSALGGAEFLTTAPLTPDAYAGRHLGVVLWGVLGIAAAAGTVATIAKSWRWGIVGAAVLASTPLWTGHSMFNIKDTPAATGYTLVTLGLVGLVDGDYFRSRRRHIISLGSLSVGLVIAIGTRTALFLPLVLTFIATWLFILLLRWRRPETFGANTRIGRRVLEGLGAYVVAYVILVAIYPKAFLNPIQVGVEAIFDSALYPVNEAQLVAGNWLIQPVHWSYQPTWFAAQLPLLSLIPFLGFLIWWTARILQALAHPISPETLGTVRQTLPVILQAVLVPLAAVVGSSTLYNGTRQMLFVSPAIAILATLGIYLLVRWRRVSAVPAVRIGVWALVALGLVIPTFVQFQLFPYGYTYFNAVTALRPIDGNWPTDYWRASGREILRNLPAGGRDSCGLEQLMRGEFTPCTKEPMFEPFLDERGLDAQTVDLADSEYWFIRENSGPLEIPPGCREFTSITRPLFWRDVTIAQIHICDDRIDTGLRNMADPTTALPQ